MSTRSMLRRSARERLGHNLSMSEFYHKITNHTYMIMVNQNWSAEQTMLSHTPTRRSWQHGIMLHCMVGLPVFCTRTSAFSKCGNLSLLRGPSRMASAILFTWELLPGSGESGVTNLTAEAANITPTDRAAKEGRSILGQKLCVRMEN